MRLSKVGVPNSVTHLNRKPICEMYVIQCGFKNGHQQDMISEGSLVKTVE